MRISDKWQNFHYLAIIVIALSSALIVQESYGSDSSKWEARREAKILRVALPSLPTSLDAIKLAFAEHFLVVECLCEALVRVDESGQITSGAAERWEYSENGRDVHFHFAKNKKFSDGSPFTAADAAKALNHHFEPGSTSDISGYLTKIVSDKHNPFEVEDPQTIVIHLKHRYAPLLQLLAIGGFCVQKATPDGIIGSGPFKVVSQSNELLRLKRNLYYENKISLNEIDFISVSSSALMAKEMKENDVDLALGMQVSEAEFLTPENFTLTKTESLGTAHLYFNVERSPELTKDVRLHLTAALQEAARKNRSMFLEPLLTLFPPEILPLRYYERPVLKEVAWTNTTKKKMLSIRLRASAFDQKLSDDIAAAVNKLGFKADVKRLKDVAYLNAMKTGDYDILGGRYLPNYPDPDAALEPFDKTSPFRLGRFNSSPLLKQLDIARAIEDNRTRLEKYTDILLNFEEEHFIVPMFRLSLPISHRPSLRLPSTNFCHEVDLWKIFWK